MAFSRKNIARLVLHDAINKQCYCRAHASGYHYEI